MDTLLATTKYKNHRFPVEIISYAVWLYFRFCLSFRDVEELLLERGVVVTYEALRTDLPHRVDLRRLRKAVRALVAVRAVRTFCLPTVVPRAYHPLHLVLRETLWVQLTAVGEVLSEHPAHQHGARWHKHQAALTARLRRLRTTLTQTDLVAVYVQQVVTLVTEVTHHLVAATDPVMVAICTGTDSPYVGVFTHIEAIAPAAHAELQQMFVRAQEARRRSFVLYHTAEQQHGKPS